MSGWINYEDLKEKVNESLLNHETDLEELVKQLLQLIKILLIEKPEEKSMISSQVCFEPQHFPVQIQSLHGSRISFLESFLEMTPNKSPMKEASQAEQMPEVLRSEVEVRSKQKVNKKQILKALNQYHKLVGKLIDANLKILVSNWNNWGGKVTKEDEPFRLWWIKITKKGKKCHRIEEMLSWAQNYLSDMQVDKTVQQFQKWAKEQSRKTLKRQEAMEQNIMRTIPQFFNKK